MRLGDEVEAVGDGFERVVDLVGDGGGEASGDGEFFGLAESFLAAFWSERSAMKAANCCRSGLTSGLRSATPMRTSSGAPSEAVQRLSKGAAEEFPLLQAVWAARTSGPQASVMEMPLSSETGRRSRRAMAWLA